MPAATRAHALDHARPAPDGEQVSPTAAGLDLSASHICLPSGSQLQLGK